MTRDFEFVSNVTYPRQMALDSSRLKSSAHPDPSPVNGYDEKFISYYYHIETS